MCMLINPTSGGCISTVGNMTDNALIQESDGFLAVENFNCLKHQGLSTYRL